MAFSHCDASCKKFVVNVCSKYLGEAWSIEQTVQVKRLLGGYANRTYLCSLQKCDGNLEEVIVKLYGSELMNGSNEFKINTAAVENVIFDRLSRLQMTPNLIVLFEEGRIEQFIHGRNVQSNDLKNLSLLSEIARKVAKFHSLSMPVSKEVKFLQEMRLKMEGVNRNEVVTDIPKHQLSFITKLFDFPLFEEINFMIKLAPNLKSPIVFSHNDFHCDNLYLNNSDSDNVLIMDFELSCYNYRGYDIGYFLLMTQFKTDHEQSQIFYSPTDNFEEVKLYFVNEYLKECKVLGIIASEEIDTVDHLVMESDILGLHYLIYHFGFWRKMLANPVIRRQICPDESAVDLIAAYNQLKQNVFDSHSKVITNATNLNKNELL